MGILDRLFKRAPRPPAVAVEEPAWVKEIIVPSNTVAGAFGFLTTSRLPRRGTQELLFAYQHSPFLRSVVAKIATNAAAVPVQLYARRGKGAAKKGRRPGVGAVKDEQTASAPHTFKVARLKALRAQGELDEITEHPMLRLLQKPWPGMRGRTLLQLTYSWLDLVGDAFWIYNTNAAGMPIEIFPVPPHWVAETPSRDRPFYTVRVNGTQFTVPVTNMLWFKDPSLENPYGRGAGVGHALADELDIDENAAKHVGSFFFNRAMPDMIVAVEDGDEDLLRATKAKFEQDYRGLSNQYRTAFLNGKVSVERLDSTFKDMNLVEIRKFSGRDVVIQAFGLSPEMLGILDNSNRATISEARVMFAENVLIPRLALVEETLQDFALLFDERLIVAFANPTPDDAKQTLEVAKAEPGARSQHEWRALQNLDPVDGGDVFLRDPTLVPVARLDDGMTDPNAETVAAEAVQDTALNGAQVSSLRQILLDVAMGLLPPSAARAAILAMFPGITPEEVDAMLADIKPGSVALPKAPASGGFGGDEDEDEEDPPPAKTFRRALRPLTKTDEDEIENILEELRPERLTSEVHELARETVSTIGVAEAAAVGAPGTFSMLNPLITEYLEDFAGTKISGLVNETTRDDLRETLVEGVRAGEGIPELSKRVRSVFAEADAVRAELIARTEVVGLSNRAIWAAHTLSGLVSKRQWVPTPDGRARDTHKPGSKLAGQVVGINQKFESSSGAKAMHPGGFGVAKEDCRCRCTTVALVNEQDAFGQADLDVMQRDFEARIAPHEAKFTAAIKRGFANQQDDVLLALLKLG